MNKIKDIYWERVNLHFVLEEAVSGEVYLLDEIGKKHLLPYKENEIIINVTNVTNGDMIEDGKYNLLIDGNEVTIESSLLKQIDSFSKIFKYRSEFYALLIELKVNENLCVYIDSSYMMKNKHYKKNFMLKEASGLKKKIITFIKIVFPFCINIFYGFLRLLKPKSTDHILFLSENDEEPRGNLKALYDYFIENNLGRTKGVFYNKFSKKSIAVLIKSVISIAFSDVIVVDNYVPLINTLNISENQRIVQLWHAGVGFKSVGYARFGEVAGPHPFKSSHRKYTTAIVDDERLIDIYKEVFAVSGDIFKSFGMPRLDGYLSKEKIEATVNKLFEDNPLLKDKKIILFSPTYRGIGASVASYDYSQLDFKAIYEFCKNNGFVFLIKMHPFIKAKPEIQGDYKEYIFNYYDYDINELIYISDIMITDYSSCAYEFSLFNRPLIFFRYDKELYEYERPVHTLDAFTEKQYEAKTCDELLNILNSLKTETDISLRFSNMREPKTDCCKKIAEEILG
ncbi:MAG: hypothetical protein E7556_08855 [Ruminococcaceae bacterium]|nr:hypothetical protein [Oscillospiraceae bacterium]